MRDAAEGRRTTAAPGGTIDSALRELVLLLDEIRPAEADLSSESRSEPEVCRGVLAGAVLGRVDDPAEPLPGGLAGDAERLADLGVGDVPLADPGDPQPQVAVDLGRRRGDQGSRASISASDIASSYQPRIRWPTFSGAANAP